MISRPGVNWESERFAGSGALPSAIFVFPVVHGLCLDGVRIVVILDDCPQPLGGDHSGRVGDLFGSGSTFAPAVGFGPPQCERGSRDIDAEYSGRRCLNSPGARSRRADSGAPAGTEPVAFRWLCNLGGAAGVSSSVFLFYAVGGLVREFDRRMGYGHPVCRRSFAQSSSDRFLFDRGPLLLRNVQALPQSVSPYDRPCAPGSNDSRYHARQSDAPHAGRNRILAIPVDAGFGSLCAC